jgi:transglutaminase-like putative cysteine protease
VTDDEQLYLAPAEYIDSDHKAIRKFAADVIEGERTDKDKAVALFRAVREIYYTVVDTSDLESFRASSVLRAGQGYCVGKASLLAASYRAAGIPARIAFADVTNHLTSPRLRRSMGTDLFAWHGYTELMLDGRWLKASPTFNSSLCAKLGVATLDFDGTADAMLQAFDGEGRQFMRYLEQRGGFHDVPAKFLAAEMTRRYPGMVKETSKHEIRVENDLDTPG